MRALQLRLLLEGGGGLEQVVRGQRLRLRARVHRRLRDAVRRRPARAAVRPDENGQCEMIRGDGRSGDSEIELYFLSAEFNFAWSC